jgi:hypothetical protein
MATSRNVIASCSITLCTLVSALAQTGVSEFRESAQVLSAEQLTVLPKADEQRRMAGHLVDEKLALWRQRLNLEDWHLSVVITRRSDLKPKTLGGIRWDKSKKSAVILVQDPADYKLPLREMLDDMELTIVHELVHLELASLPRSEASRGSEEHAVTAMAAALVGLDKQK